MQTAAIHGQRAIQRADLQRNISSSVVVASGAVARSIEQVIKAREAVAFYQKAMGHEEKKLHLGMSTLIDVATMDDYLRRALLAEVSSRQAYAAAVARLRHETGTLILTDNDKHKVSGDTLTRVPTE